MREFWTRLRPVLDQDARVLDRAAPRARMRELRTWMHLPPETVNSNSYAAERITLCMLSELRVSQTGLGGWLAS